MPCDGSRTSKRLLNSGDSNLKQDTRKEQSNMEKIMSRMTGEELLLLRILDGEKVASDINAELDHRAQMDTAAPIWARAGRTSRANWIITPPSSLAA